MARIERRFDIAPARRPATGHGSASGATRVVDDTIDDPDDQGGAPRERQWTLDRIEKIIGSIA